MSVEYKFYITPEINKITELYKRSGIPRPIHDKERIAKMYENSNLVISAWAGDELVGIVRCISDLAWYTFLADLAVDPAYKTSGIGKKLIHLSQEIIGEKTATILLSVPTAMEYYPKIGFTKDDRAFSIPRKK